MVDLLDPSDFAAFAEATTGAWEQILKTSIEHNRFGIGSIVEVTRRRNQPTLVKVQFRHELKLFTANAFGSGVFSLLRIPDALAVQCEDWKVDWAAEQVRSAAEEKQRGERARERRLAEAAKRERLEAERLNQLAAEERARAQAVAARRGETIDALRTRILAAQQASLDLMRKMIAERAIEKLVHFTRAENLASILERGILSREALSGTPFLHNDEVRVDGYPEVSCISIEFPNYRMFSRYKFTNREANWAVITMSSRVLLEKPCLFYPSNAASYTSRQLAQESLVAFEGLQRMFGDQEGLRKKLELPNGSPTDPQAEILVFDAIEREFFEEIHVLRRDPMVDQVGKQLPRAVPIRIGGAMFAPRSDYKHWQDKTAVVDTRENPASGTS